MSLALKKTILAALESDDLAAVAALAVKDRKVLSQLVRVAYDKETLVGWRAIKAVGLVASRLVTLDRECLRETCRKLLWSLTDESGGIGWSAPELLGEIVSADPGRFADIVPLIVQAYDVEEDVFRPGVVYALGRIAEKDPGVAARFQKILISSLVDANPLVRIHGLRLVEKLWTSGTAGGCWSREYCERVRGVVAGMKADRSEAWVYEGPQFRSIMVGEKAEEVENRLN